jgi:hypothetical protein
LNLLLEQGPVAPGVPVTPGSNASFDLTGDGLINNADVDRWLADSADRIGLSNPFRRGDANLDGLVNGSDFGQWNSHKFSSTLLWDHGDFNGDGLSDGSDLGLWNANKSTNPEGIAVVPEPGRWLLVHVAAGIVTLASTRGRSWRGRRAGS